MKKATLQKVSGNLAMVLYSTLISLVIILYSKGGFLFDEMTTIFSIVFPVIVSYVSLHLSRVMKDRKKIVSGSVLVSVEYAYTLIALLVIFFASIHALVITKSFNWTEMTFEQFKYMFAFLQTALGAYTFALYKSQF